jgi:hypothetical protein
MKRLLLALGLLCLLGCEGEVYYKTPQTTLQRYLEFRHMGSAMEIEAALNCFRRDDKQWWENKNMRVCELKYGKFNSMCGEGLANKAAVWNDLFEPYGPQSENITSSDIDEKEGSATLVIDGKEFYFVRDHKNWKFDSLFGIREELEQQWPELAEK